MDKIMFYVNDWEDVKRIIPHINIIRKNYQEIAFSTDDNNLAELLAVGKLLVVKYGTYNPNVIVSTVRLKETYIPLEEFLLMVEE